MMLKQFWIDVRARLAGLFGRDRLHSRIGEETQFHLEMREQRLIESGVAPADARHQARREFGNPTRVTESSREAWGWIWLEHLGQDLRYAFRAMASHKLFTLLAVLSLALGIGANTAIYSFMDAILLRSLPVPEPQSLVTLNWNTPAPPGQAMTKTKSSPRPQSVAHMVFQSSGGSYSDPEKGSVISVFPYAAFELFQGQDSPFANVFAYQPGRLNVLFNERTDVIDSVYVSGEFFNGLGVLPAAGRLVNPDDDRNGAPPVAVLSHSYWTRRFGGNTQILGQTVHVNNTAVTIVGVAPPEFFGVDAAANPDLYLPLRSNLALSASGPFARLQGWYTDPNFYWLEIMARLKPGITMEQAQAALTLRFHDFVASTAGNDQERAQLPALLIKEGAAGLDVLRRQYSQPLYLLMTLVGLILAIACANISNLLLARAASRHREMAVRLSMGASRGRVIRQLLTESVLLSALGGALGVALALGGIRVLTVLLANGRENFTLRSELNWQVLGVTAGLSIFAGIFFGLAPALRSTRVDVLSALKDIRTGPSRERLRGGWARVNLGQILVIGQIAVSLLLLVAAGLFVRTLSNLESIRLGFNRENLLLFEVSPLQAGLPAPALTNFYLDLRDRLAQIPGVINVTHSSFALLSGGGMSMGIDIPGVENAQSLFLHTGPSFFETMQIPMVQGRTLNDRDRAGTPRVAVVNEAFVRTYLNAENAVGKTFNTNNGRDPMEIVGVAANARYSSLKDDIEPTVYVPAAQAPQPMPGMTYEVRTAGNPLLLGDTARRLVQQIDARIPVTRVRTQAAQVDQTINQEIVFARLCTGFGMLALLIACVGLYGTTAYHVARRTGEIGIRMALGARQGSVLWMVLREVGWLCVLGVAVGVPMALGASRFMESLLFRTKPNDPVAVTGAVAVMLVAALLAAYAPAHRASQIDPMEALRQE